MRRALVRGRNVFVKIIVACGMVAFGALASEFASAQNRFVFVNGQRMTDQQITLLEHYHCSFIPNGAYWVNIVNGAWGYVGNPIAQGYFGDQCYLPANRGAYQRRQSLSERGLLYTPGEILSGR